MYVEILNETNIIYNVVDYPSIISTKFAPIGSNGLREIDWNVKKQTQTLTSIPYNWPNKGFYFYFLAKSNYALTPAFVKRNIAIKLYYIWPLHIHFIACLDQRSSLSVTCDRLVVFVVIAIGIGGFTLKDQ
jgi:hypothetical protein